MTYRAKEVKKITEFSHSIKDFKISIGKATGCVRFFWLDDHLEIEEKLWHPLIILKYLIVFVLWLPLLAVFQSSTPIFGIGRFRSSFNPEARKITDKKEIEEAIQKDKTFRKSEFDKHSWV